MFPIQALQRSAVTTWKHLTPKGKQKLFAKQLTTIYSTMEQESYFLFSSK